MKLALLALITVTPMALLFSCDNSDWVNEYGTPKLMLEHCENEDMCYYFLNDDDSKSKKDENFTIKNMLLTVDEYKGIDKPDELSGDYFTYYHIRSFATSGPNHCDLRVYENGYVELDYKASLAKHKYRYFSINPIKALEINNFVKTLFNK